MTVIESGADYRVLRFQSLRGEVICPNCAKPISVLRGLNADCKPISMIVHRVDLKTWRPGTFSIA